MTGSNDSFVARIANFLGARPAQDGRSGATMPIDLRKLANDGPLHGWAIKHQGQIDPRTLAFSPNMAARLFVHYQGHVMVSACKDLQCTCAVEFIQTKFEAIELVAMECREAETTEVETSICKG